MLLAIVSPRLGGAVGHRRELYARLDFHLERVVRRLLELDDRQCARRGSDRKRGDMTIRQIVDEMLAGHIEEHCTQMAASLA